MADFTHPLASFAQGAMSGAQMGLQIDQAQRARKQQEWDNDFRMMSAALNMAGLKGIAPQTQAKILNESVAPVWKKWTGQDFPMVDPANPENNKDINGLVKDLGALGKQGAEGKAPWPEIFRLGHDRVAAYHAQLQNAAEVGEREKAAIDSAMAPIKAGMEGATRAQDRAGKDAKTPEEIMKEMFDINTKVTGMQQLDQQTANLMKIAPEAASQLVGSRLTPEQLGQVKGMGAARMRELNNMLPENRRLREISPKTFKALLAGKHPDTGQPLPGGPQTPEAIYRRAYVAE